MGYMVSFLQLSWIFAKIIFYQKQKRKMLYVTVYLCLQLIPITGPTTDRAGADDAEDCSHQHDDQQAPHSVALLIGPSKCSPHHSATQSSPSNESEPGDNEHLLSNDTNQTMTNEEWGFHDHQIIQKIGEI